MTEYKLSIPRLASRSEWQALDDKLATGLDLSWVEKKVTQFQKAGPRSTAYVAEGRHFQVYTLSLPRGLRAVIKLAKPQFYRGLGTDRSRWLQRFHDLNTLSPLLFLPARAHCAGDQLWVLSPLCERFLNLGEKKALSKDLENFLTELGSQGYELADDPHLMAWGNLAFIVDWSDLGVRLGDRALAGSGSSKRHPVGLGTMNKERL